MKIACSQSILGITLLFSPVALSVPPYYPDLTSNGNNRWDVSTFSLEDGKEHGWKDYIVCFRKKSVDGAHQIYEWTSARSFGHAAQEGDQIFMYGFSAERTRFNHMTWELSNKNRGAGYMKEWRIPHNPDLDHFSKVMFKRNGSCAGNNTTSNIEEQDPNNRGDL